MLQKEFKISAKVRADLASFVGKASLEALSTEDEVFCNFFGREEADSSEFPVICITESVYCFVGERYNG